MKPYASYKGNNLVDIIPRAIAFVTEGANKKRFFLFKTKNTQGENAMDKTLAISLIKGGKLSTDQVTAIVAAVNEDDRAEVLAIAKGGDPEGATMATFMKEFLPSLIKTEVKRALKKAGAPMAEDTGKSGVSGEESGNSQSCMKEILAKLDDILENEESKDEDLQKALADEEKSSTVPNYADLKKKWEDGTLDDAESKEYMKAKTAMRKKARQTLKSRRLKAEKDAIAELTSEEGKKNQDGNMGSSGFDKNIKKIFADDREITDPEEITKLMELAKSGVENGSL